MNSTKSNTGIPTIAVIGGGIGGLSVALFLRQAGFKDIQIYEARSYDRVWEQACSGNGIHLYFQCARMLRQAGLPIDDYVRPLDVRFRREDGRVTADITRPVQLKLKPALKATKASCYTILRQHLYKMLLDATPTDTLHCQKKVVAIETHASPLGETEAVFFEDGTEINADLVIGADGIHSKVARFVNKNDTEKRPIVKYDGVILQGYSTHQMENEAEAWLLHSKGGTAGLLPTVLPSGRVGLVWWLSAGSSVYVGKDLNDADQYMELAKELSSRFSYDEIAKTMEKTDPTSIQRWEFQDRDPLKKGQWVSKNSRIVLLGDACHAALPTTGYGAGMTIEDAYWLAHELGKDSFVLHRPHDLKCRLGKYQARRAPWTGHIVKEGRLLMKVAHASNPIVTTLLRLGWSSGIPGKIVARKFANIYHKGLKETMWTPKEKKKGMLEF